MILRRIGVAVRQQDWATVSVEFLLVVLGILLALEVDNWNQQRHDSALFQNYLTQLRFDLEQDTRSAEWIVQSTQQLDDAAEYVTAAITRELGDEIDRSRLIRSILIGGYANLNLTNRATYDELLSTGNLRILGDTELRRAVVSYYSVWESGMQWNSLIRGVQQDYRRNTRKLLNAEQFRWARTNLSDEAAEAPMSFDLGRFYALTEGDEELLGVISAMAEVQQRIRDDAEYMQRKASELSQKLASYQVP